jgi:RNA polymerase sigma factor (sigma-70 family)
MKGAFCTVLTQWHCDQLEFYYQNARRPLTSYAYRLIENSTDAQDLVSDAFLQLSEEVKSGEVVLDTEEICHGDPTLLPERIPPHDKTVAWLYKATTHKAWNLVRSRKREGEAVQRMAQQAFSGDPHQALMRTLQRQRLIAALDKLTPRQSYLLYAHACGVTYQELADIEGIKVGTLSSLMTRALGALRIQYLACDLFGTE